MAENPHSQSFDQVLRDELAHIRYRREVIHRWAAGDRADPQALLDPEGLTGKAPPVGGEMPVSGGADASSGLRKDRAVQNARKEALKENLAGLAFSGGGIRAATFAVGIMQGLAGLKLLRFFDVISSVSGGGYANSWLGAWVRREGDPLNVEKQLDVGRIEQSEARRFPITGERNRVGEFSQVVDEEPEPLHHLRQFSSFLNPRPGLLSADTWTVVAIYLRNVTINLLLLLPLVGAIALLGWALVVVYRDLLIAPEAGVSHSQVMPGPWQRLYGVGAIMALVAVFTLNARALWTIRARPDRESRIGKGTIWAIVGLLLAAAVMLTITYQPMLNQAREFLPRILPGWFSKASMGKASYLSRINLVAHAVVLGGFLFAGSLVYWVRYTWRRLRLERVERHNRARLAKADLSQSAVQSAERAVEKADQFLAMHRERRTRGQGWMWEPVAALVAGATGGLLVCCVEELLRPTIESSSPTPWLLAMIGPPLLLVVVIVAITILVALLGPRADEQEREWWARLSAGLLLASIYWVVLIATIVYGPCLLLGSGRLVAALMATGWVGTTIAGVLAGKSRTSGTGEGGSGAGVGGFVVKLLVAAAPTVFLLGLLAASSLVVAMFFRGDAISALKPASGFREASAAILNVSFLKDQKQLQVSVWVILGTLIAVLASACAVLPFVNVNLFSLHAMYANRLTRTFLGASRRKEDWRRRWATVENDRRVLAGAPTGAMGSNREPNPVTGFDRGDDLDLLELRIGQGDERARYWGPHLIFNTALNLVGGQELAWRDRKAESFAMTPLHTGSRTTGYAVTGPETRGNVSVGKAVAVSGAAVDPNMSFYQSGPMTALLTVFNARLGVWIQNPNRETWRSLWNTQKWKNEKWSGRGAAFGGLLLRELGADVSSGYRYVHLSDGGHFENLGVYELIRRRCRYIVAVDATENSNATSDNLGVLIRLCRVDFGIRIQIDTTPLTLSGPDGLSATHVVIGLIRYDDVDHGQTPGMLVYVRSSMTGDEPPDVQQYANLHPEFPRQLTLSDQSFDEDQFESYRALGDHIARTVFEPAARELFRQHDGDQEWWSKEGFSDGRTAFIRGHRKLFTALRNCWSSPMAASTSGGGLVDWSRRWERLQRDLRREPALAELARELYPELPNVEAAKEREAGQKKPNISEAERQAATVHAMEQVLQLMEDTWLGLKGDDAAAISGGWLNTLRRLTGTESFRRYWPMLSPQYSREFARFCEQTLRVKTGQPEVVGATTRPEDLAELGGELAREWPAMVKRRENETLAEAGARFLNELAGQAIDPSKEAGAKPTDAKLVTPLAWQVVQRPVEHQAAREGELSFPVGVLFVCPIESEEKQRIGLAAENGPCFELLVWIRRAHRGVGLGERVLQTVEFQALVKWLEAQGASLLVRYPETPEVAVEDQNRLSWLSFFSLYDFEPVCQMRLKPGKEWRLVRKFGA